MSEAMATEPPAGLPDHLREVWEQIAPTVQSRIGTAGMEALCGQVYRLRSAEEAITRDGLVVSNPKGGASAAPGANRPSVRRSWTSAPLEMSCARR